MTEQNRKLRRRQLIKWPHFIVRAIWELARARFALRSLQPNGVRDLNRSTLGDASRRELSGADEDLVARIGFVTTFVARHVPWRSDCLPQAIAAQRWLLAEGIGSEIRIGVERPDDGEFGAHAWLVQDHRIVVGGDVAHFAVLLGDEKEPLESAQNGRSHPSES